MGGPTGRAVRDRPCLVPAIVRGAGGLARRDPAPAVRVRDGPGDGLARRPAPRPTRPGLPAVRSRGRVGATGRRPRPGRRDREPGQRPVGVSGLRRSGPAQRDERLDGRSFDGWPHGKQTWYTSTSGLLGSVRVDLAPDPRFAALVVLPDLEARHAQVRWRLVGNHVGDPATVALAVTSPAGRIVAEVSTDAHAGSASLADPPAPTHGISGSRRSTAWMPRWAVSPTGSLTRRSFGSACGRSLSGTGRSC